MCIQYTKETDKWLEYTVKMYVAAKQPEAIAEILDTLVDSLVFITEVKVIEESEVPNLF